MAEARRFLLDVNVLIALAKKGHSHHGFVTTWFEAGPDMRWSVCAFTEAGFLRNMTAPFLDQVEISQATQILAQLTRHPGYSYLPIDADWQTLSAPFLNKLQGTKQSPTRTC